jgi:hypothetical protein
MSSPPPGAMPPAVPPPPVVPTAPVAALAPIPAPAGRRRTGLLALGIVVALAGAAAGIGLIAASGSKEGDAVEDLARAPIACTTTLHVESPTTFVVFLETKGRMERLDGGCVDHWRDYAHSGTRQPPVDLTLTNADGDELTLARRGDITYDVDGYRGTAIGQVTIGQAGDYQLTALSSADDVAIAIGKDPNGAGDPMRNAGVIVLVVGVALGLVLLLLGLRRTPVAAPMAPAVAAPGAGWVPPVVAPVVAPPAAPQPFAPPAPPATSSPPSPVQPAAADPAAGDASSDASNDASNDASSDPPGDPTGPLDGPPS